MSAPHSTHDALVFLSHGKLHWTQGGEPPAEVVSEFARSVERRAQTAWEKNAWKVEGGGQGLLFGAQLWGRVPVNPEQLAVRVTGLAAGPEQGQILYALHTGDVAGLFVATLGQPQETRLLHTTECVFEYPAVHRETREIVCTVRRNFASANIAVLTNGNSRFREVTEGETIDLAPRWRPGTGRRIVYQSAGVGRDPQGNFGGYGAYHICELDLDTGQLKTLHEDPQRNLLAPRVGDDGALYFIRAPYTGNGAASSLKQLAIDFVMFPYRIARACFGWLNFFSMRYTGEPLTNSRGFVQKQAEMHDLFVLGNLVRAQHRIRPDSQESGLVPRSWELVRRASDGDERVIADGVLSYDLLPDGSVVTADGRAVRRLRSDGTAETLVRHRGIEQVILPF